MKIKFGTDGWRAIIAKEFTVHHVARVTVGVAQWIKKSGLPQKAVVGHDCRFNGELFTTTVVGVLHKMGIEVVVSKGFVSTPMISLAARDHKAAIGIIITASHNPPEYSGYKLKSHFGGPLTPEKVAEVETLIPDKLDFDPLVFRLDKLIESKKVKIGEFEKEYLDKVKSSFNLKAINDSGIKLAYDAMYGAGQRVFKTLFPNSAMLHCEHNPGFNGTAPEPIMKNLGEFSQFIIDKKNIDLGIATDGDADRIGLFNGKGEFVDSHHIILLLIHYMCKYKNTKGKVVTAFSTTPRVEKICKHYGIELQVVPIGFKYIAGIMEKDDRILIGGEESGGIAIKGHIPERDGIWIGLVLAEFIALSGKKLDELIKEVYEITGSFVFHRNDLHLEEEQKISVVQKCKSGGYKNFGSYAVERVEDMDGYKFFLGNDEWIMIRASGTEPVLRVYAESGTRAGVDKIFKEALPHIQG